MIAPAKSPLIFFLGFNKSGTTSLHDFMLRNSIESIHWDKGNLALAMYDNFISGRRLLVGYDHRYTSYSDMFYLSSDKYIEGNQYFKLLDQQYPGSYFVYNYRPLASWVRSRLRHKGKTVGETLGKRFLKYYNIDTQFELVEKWIHTRKQYEEDIRIYFESNANFLSVNIELEDAALKLCSFLPFSCNAAHWRWLNKSNAL